MTITPGEAYWIGVAVGAFFVGGYFLIFGRKD